MFFPSEVIDQITIQTNLYHDQVNQGKELKTNWIPVTKEEIKAFLRINIAMGIVNLPEMKSYWAKGITRVPWFPSIMSRPRFEQICHYLHLADNSKQPDKDSKEYKLYKLGKIDEKVNEAAARCCKPKQQLSIDEQMVRTNVRISFLQYLPKKPKKFGVKLWVLAEALTGYCLRFQIYTGKCGDKTEHGLSHRVVMN